MNSEQINLIRRSFEKISAGAFAENFYNHLFLLQPALRLLFPDDFRKQKEKLMQMLEAAIEMLDDPEKLVPLLEETGRRHALYGAREEHYEPIGAAFLKSLREVSGADFTAETEAVWAKLYEEMSEIMKQGARRLTDTPEQYQEKNIEEKIRMKKQNAIVNTIRIFLMAVILGLFSAAAANAETMFVANLNGLGQVPPANTSGKGFAVLVLNDSETQATFQLYFEGLHSIRTTGALHFPGTAAENVAPSIPIIFGSSPSTLGYSTSTIGLTSQDLQHLKNGLWYIQINSEMFPNGEIRGQFYPYSPFIANMDCKQISTDGGSVAGGKVLIAVSKDQSLMAYYYNFIGINSLPAKVSILSGIPGQIGTWDLDLTLPDLPASASGTGIRQTGSAPGQELIGRLKRGLLYAIVTTEADFPVGEIRGQLKPMNKTTDFDGDNRADIAVYRENTGVWYRKNSLASQPNVTQFGLPGDVPAHADYDGDGLTDIAVYRANTGEFFVLRSKDGVIQIVRWGQAGDKPAPADFDGDGKADYVISRPNGQQKEFWILGSLNNSVRMLQWGLDGDQFLPADFDGDRVNDLTVYRPGNQTFYSILSLTNTYKFQKWGTAGDIAKIVDFDGDGKSEYAVYRTNGPEAGTWWTLYNTGVSTVFKFGLGTDRPVPSDYDGDGRIDFAIYRDGNWWIRKSSNGNISVTNFGLPDDITITQ